MTNLIYLFGGIFTSSLIFLYNKPKYCYSILLKTSSIYNKVKNLKQTDFEVKSINEVEYNSNNYLKKGKEIYKKRFYSNLLGYFSLEYISRNINIKYLITYTMHNNTYIMIGDYNSIKNLGIIDRKKFNNKIVMALDGTTEITDLLNKYIGINNDYHYYLTQRRLSVKDIIKEDNSNIKNQLTIIESNGNIKILNKDDYLN